jgi:hypothetical protein
MAVSENEARTLNGGDVFLLADGTEVRVMWIATGPRNDGFIADLICRIGGQDLRYLLRVEPSVRLYPGLGTRGVPYDLSGDKAELLRYEMPQKKEEVPEAANTAAFRLLLSWTS